MILDTGKDTPEAALSDEALDILERYGRELQTCDQAGQQVRRTLTAVRDSLRADAVFWCPLPPTEKVEVAGRTDLTPEWCRSFVQTLLAENPGSDSQLLKNRTDGDAPSATPSSAALVRLSRSRATWLVAVNFDPKRPFTKTDVKLMALARRMLLNERANGQAHEKLKDTLFGLIHCLTATIDAKDNYTCGHSERVARIAARLGREMNLPAAILSDLYLAGLLHDVGKIGVPDQVLLKPGKLDDKEQALMREHAVIGDHIVSKVKHLNHLRPGVRNHHERYDGEGYPDRLAGTNIPLLARVLAVSDACDAMMSVRPYRGAMPTHKIDAILSEGAGSHWDPQVIEHFMACRHELYPICQRGIGESAFVAVQHVVAAEREAAGQSMQQSTQRPADGKP